MPRSNNSEDEQRHGKIVAVRLPMSLALDVESAADRAENSAASAIDWQRGKWLAQIKIKAKAINLGRYQTQEEALTARGDAARKHFGQFA